MTLTAGTRLGSYQVTTLIGVGGMGEVYRARDTRLDRDVALKVLPDAFAQDAERLARFQREAKVLASLNHPNIAAIYGLEEADGVKALVLELVEGPTLADRIAQGSVPLDEALRLAKQIAEALEAAHELGIVHRDLKPANVKVRDDGTVKVLDFGLAKALAPEPGTAAAANLTQSPTITSPAALGTMTGVGVLLGTAAYMSPEQAKGRAVDKRSDIWAFGCVLYEMLTGRRAFEGDDVSDTLAFIITKNPDWTALPVGTAPGVRKLLRRCLEKDPKRRLRDIGDARMEIDEGSATDALTAVAAVASVDARTTTRWSRALPWTLAVGSLAVVGALVVWAPWQAAGARPAPMHLEATLGADASLLTSPTDQGAAAVLAPNGGQIAFVAETAAGASQLFVRPLEQLQATPLAGTEGARSPFFSPDGQWVAFFAGGKLRKVAVTGGAAVTICDAADNRGGTWGEDGTIVFAPGNRGVGLLRVSSAGGTPEPLTTLADGETTQRWPQLLPGGKAVLFTSQGGFAGSGFEDATLVVQPLPSGPRTVVQRGGYYGRYVSSGHLVYVHEGTLFAAAFDLARLATTAPAVPVLEGLVAAQGSGVAQFAAADTGTLVYAPGVRGGSTAPLSWMDREGKVTPLRAMAANWADPQFAPDGRQIAMTIEDGQQDFPQSDVWVYDWARDTLSRLTFDPAQDRSPVWSPDGHRIVFASRRGGGPLNLYSQRADGTGEAQRLTESATNDQRPTSWHPSGKWLAFTELTPQNAEDVMILPMEGDGAAGWTPGKPTVFLNSRFRELSPRFSPDGRWIAYQSDESGQMEAYVRPFPGPGGKWQISTGGGLQPTWSHARHELFHSTLDERIIVVPYTVDGESFRAATPRLWSQTRFIDLIIRATGDDYDLHPDGNRFALGAASEAQAETRQNTLVFVVNFFDELRRIAPVGQR